MGTAGPRCNIEPLCAAGLSPIAILSAERADLTALVQSLQEWGSARALEYNIAGHPDWDDIVNRLVCDGAFPQSGSPMEVAKSEANIVHRLCDMLAAGLVTQEWVRDHYLGFLLSERGVQHIQVGQRLVSPRSVFQGRVDDAIEDFSAWELLNALDVVGWRMVTALASSARRALLEPHQPDSRRQLWYCAGVDVCKSRKYIACLLHCDALFAKGVAQICHCQKPLYYARLWGGKSNGLFEQDAQPLQDSCQLELDVEPDEVAGAIQAGGLLQ